MGTIIQGSCAKCGYQERVQTGGGMEDCKPETALALTNNNKDLAAALNRQARFSILRGIASCTNCRKLVTGVQVTYGQEHGAKSTILSSCPQCGGALEWPDSDAAHILCPVCRAPMSFHTIGHWD